jgi:hypothetical protein
MQTQPLKLNLGCGSKILPGYCNVDKYGAPDLRWDLERFPWPWADDSVEEILLVHTLEHLGQAPETFIGLIKEIYRVCRNGACVHIAVPHPRHDHYLGDPTHVRPITIDTMALFSRRQNLEWQRLGGSNTPLALHHQVDFELTWAHATLDEPYHSLHAQGQITQDQLRNMEKTMFNIVKQIEMTLKVVKPFASVPSAGVAG